MGESPSASFTDTASIRASGLLQWKPGKHFLGVIDAQIKEEKLPDGRLDRFSVGGMPVGIFDDRHIVTISGSRGGKGRAGIVPNLLAYPGSVLAIDPKGELASLTASRRAAMGQNVIVLDPFGVAGQGAENFRKSFNPVEFLDPDNPTIVEDAGLISDAIVVPDKGARDSHWDESAKNFIEGLTLHVATAVEFEGNRNLVTVYNKLASVDDALKLAMESSLAASGAIADAAKAFFDKPDNERESVLSTARRHARFLGYPQMQAVLSGESISLSKLKTEPTTIYLCLPALRLGTCSRWLRMVINMTLAAMEHEKAKPALPVMLVLDEFAVLGHMKTVEDAAGQLAGFSVKLWTILQDLGQLKALYAERWETFLGNAGIVQVFSNSDLTTLEWISKRLGETTVRTESQAPPPLLQRADTAATGKSYGSQVQPLLTPEEVSRYFGRDDRLLRQLIIVAGYPPLILQRAFYDRHEIFSAAPEARRALKR